MEHITHVSEPNGAGNSRIGLEESLSLLKTAFNNTNIGILVFDKSGAVINYNERLLNMWQLPATALSNNESVKEFIKNIALQIQDDHQFIRWFDELMISINTDNVIEWRCKDSRYIQCYIRPQRVKQQVIGCLIGFRDITARKHSDEVMHLQQRAIEASADGIIIFDAVAADAAISYVNPAFERITGYAAEEAVGKDWQSLLGRHNQNEIKNLFSTMRDGSDSKAILRNYRKDGSLFWSEMHIAPVRTDSGDITHFVGIITDVTNRKSMEEQLVQQATHDALTGLPNRTLLMDRIAQAVAYSSRANTQVAVLFIDLDRFKYVNDTFGHTKGDALLKIATQRLMECIRESDTVARLGGDEFVVLLTGISDDRNIIALAEKMLEHLAKPYMLDNQEVVISASIGISIYPKDGDDAEILLKNADIAMYRAKDTGRCRFHFFTDELNQRIVKRAQLERSLHHVLERQELLVYYQPIINLRTQQIGSFEALLRWQHPTLGIIPPLEFISLAEETGLIISIGEWLIRKTCNQVKAWHQQGLPKVGITINLSVKQLKQPFFVEMVKRILQETNLEPMYLAFELTESIIMDNLTEAGYMLTQLKQLGVRIAIDDFGTGYSSLSYLKKLPVDKLKIDKSFIDNITEDEESAAIVKAIIAMARSLKLQVLAEGVETAGQAKFLREIDCDEVQGFYFSKPVTSDECLSLLQEKIIL